MIVRSYNTELGYELIATLPYAYYLHITGKLKGTVSAVGSEPFYFFSPDHKIDPTPRDFAHTKQAVPYIPNMNIHQAELDTSEWVPPPLKEHYMPRAITFHKPTVVIYNRYNYEWGKPPINYFDIPTLRRLFDMLKDKYQIVYFNIHGQEELEDHAHSMHLGDFDMIREEYPEVITIHDLMEREGEDYNTVQLRVFAGCSKFITMNGAPSILASYFGGENIIYTKTCREVRESGSFYGWYHLFGKNTHVRVVRSYEDLIERVDTLWANEPPPLLNILVRCHDRPGGIKRLLDSIDYPNYRVIASYDNQSTLKYIKLMPLTRVKVTPRPHRTPPPGEEYSISLPANEYLNTLMDHVTDGYIMFIDDDDLYTQPLTTLIPHLHPDRMLLWRMTNRDGNTIPSDEYFGTITVCQISTITVCFHHSHKDKARWTPWRRGDFRFIRDLSKHVKPHYLDMILSKCGPRDKPVSKPLNERAYRRLVSIRKR